VKKDSQTPHEIRQRIWKELGRASKDRHHAWRTPVLATTGQDGTVNARTVVLRSVDQASQTLQIFTDQRSPKVAEIANEPRAMFVFWSARLNWQLRVRVFVTNQTDGAQVEAHWQKVQQTAAASDYLGALAPGSLCAETYSASTPPEQANNFTLLIAQIVEIDWLELGRSGHRRAQLLENTWKWLAP
jgi:hypothetical protein